MPLQHALVRMREAKGHQHLYSSSVALDLTFLQCTRGNAVRNVKSATLARRCGRMRVRTCVRRATTSVPLPGLLHSMSSSSLAAVLPVDGRQSPTALRIARGTTRLLHTFGFSVLSELPLASGRRADLVALGTDGEIWIVE